MPLTLFGGRRTARSQAGATVAIRNNPDFFSSNDEVDEATEQVATAPHSESAENDGAFAEEGLTARIQLDYSGRIKDVNSSAAKILKVSAASLHGRLAEDFLAHDADVVGWREQLSQALGGRELFRQKWSFGSGSESNHFQCDIAPFADESGKVEGVLIQFMDITSQRRDDAALQEVEVKYRELLENSAVGIFTRAPDGRYVHVNAALAKVLGYTTVEELLAQPPQDYREFFIDAERAEEYSRLQEEQGEVQEFEARVYRHDGSIIWIEENSRAVRDLDGRVLRYEGSIQDITRRKEREAHLLRHAFHDKLTGLPDRTLFLERVNRCLRRRERHPNYWFAVLFLDLDRFKIVNDSLGHVIGDQLLIATARKLEGCLRPGDTVARLGGDEFAILLDDIKDVGDATHVAERILNQLSQPAVLDGHDIYTTTSIGIALVSGAYERAEDLLRDADVAMYRAKALGKARYAVFDAEMYADGKNLLQLEADLRAATVNQEFRVEYQPVINLVSGSIEGFEAFLRWHHPQRGLIPPSDFVPIAEETGLLVGLDRWVLGEACRQMYTWQKQFPMHSLLTMSVNLSSRQFAQSDLVGELQRIIKRSGLAPRCLRLELTERSLLANPDAAEETILQLKELGVQLSLDDFGTGYSSLSHLHRFSFDTLKVDRSFISQMDTARNMEIVRAIITIAHNLNISVVAEGIETAEQLTQLREYDCHYGQGYLFSGPLEAGAIRELIATKPRW